MRIMFVCTGNICRSPMGELLMSHYLTGTTVQVSSAGTRGLPMHPIDPSSGRLMDSVGIESSGFHSRRLTRQMADDADLILCFEKQQRKDIVTLAPAAVRYTFLLNDFANMCDYCAQHSMVTGTTIQERLESVIRRSSMIRPIFRCRKISTTRTAANSTNSASPPTRPTRRFAGSSKACANITTCPSPPCARRLLPSF